MAGARGARPPAAAASVLLRGPARPEWPSAPAVAAPRPRGPAGGGSALPVPGSWPAASGPPPRSWAPSGSRTRHTHCQQKSVSATLCKALPQIRGSEERVRLCCRLAMWLRAGHFSALDLSLLCTVGTGAPALPHEDPVKSSDVNC